MGGISAASEINKKTKVKKNLKKRIKSLTARKKTLNP